MRDRKYPPVRANIVTNLNYTTYETSDIREPPRFAVRHGPRRRTHHLLRPPAEHAHRRGNRRRLGAALRREEPRPVERLQRGFAHTAVARRRRLHPGQRRRQRPFGLYRHPKTVRKLHPRLGVETLARRQQRHALPRGRGPLLRGTLRHRPRIPAHRRGGLGGAERSDEARGVAAPGRRLRHAPPGPRGHAAQSAGRVELVAHRLRQRPCRALAQRREDPRIRSLDRRLVRPQGERQMGDRSRIRTGPPRRDLPAGPRLPGLVPQPEDQGAAPQGRQRGFALQRP